MQKIALTVFAILLIGCAKPSIEVKPGSATIPVGDTVMFIIDAKNYDRITASLDSAILFEFTPDTYSPPYQIRWDDPGYYEVYWSAEKNGSRVRIASTYTYITVTD